MWKDSDKTRLTGYSSETNAITKGSPWRIAAYRRVWFSTVIIALANWCERIAIGWLVLIETDSVFLTAASFAIQKAPASLVAPVAGDISDRISRSRILAVTAFCKAIIVLTLAVLTSNGINHLWMVFALVALGGIGQTFAVPATQGLITDIVPQRMVMRAVALQTTGARGVGAVGSLVGGLTITSFGVPAALNTGAFVFLIGAFVMATMPRYRSARTAPGTIGLRILMEAVTGLISLMRLPIVGPLFLIAFVVEIFAFAYQAILPSVARDVLNVDADGLGTLTLMAGFGAVIGVAILATVGDLSRKGILLIGVTIAFGLMLMVFASSGIFPLSLLLVMGIGAMAAVFDTLQWTLLQQHVPDAMRGLVIGGWMFVISFGWIGQLTMGAMAQAIGVQWALGGAGGLVVLTGIMANVFCSRLRAT
jgi:MFS family permease